MDARDRELGMHRPIRRRDFLDGMALAVGGTLVGGLPAWAAPSPSAPYPPALTGLRGSHDGSWEVAHRLRDGSFWENAGPPLDTGESYDLVVVGAGISGLAAAYFFRKLVGPAARVLILDNHDDFGGHARRNEFHESGRLFLGYGGTYAIDSPAPYSAVAKALVAELGVEVSRFPSLVDGSVYAGLKGAVFFDRETFGEDRLVLLPGEGRKAHVSRQEWEGFFAQAPLSDAARRDLLGLHTEPADALPGMTSAEKKACLAGISYADFLMSVLGLDPGVVSFLQARTHGLYGVGIDAVSAQDAWGLSLPGFEGMGLDTAPGPGMGLDAIRHPEAEEYFFHFPDGNSSVARLLLRRLVPQAVPGRSADDIVTTRTDYGRLDRLRSPVRVRLSSTVVRVRHRGRSLREVEVSYVRKGKMSRVRGRHCVLACWHAVIPYLCPELPAPQKEALSRAVKVPLVYTSVLLRDWRSFRRLGVREAHCPGAFHNEVELAWPLNLGAYQSARTPEEPMVVHLGRTPCDPGQSAPDQHRHGRAELMLTTFEEFERATRDQLARLLGAGGFEPARDIRAITVNRWPHGYAYQYNSLWDPFWLEGGERPCEVARRPHGRIAIANADAAAYAYTDAAIDQAHRAVSELLD